MLSIDENDQEMLQAIKDARATIGMFFDAFESPNPNQRSFLIKARFSEGENHEHIWLADLDFSTNPARGRVANETDFPGLKYLQMTSFGPEQITDWMFYQGDEPKGAYTSRLLMKRQKQIH